MRSCPLLRPNAPLLPTTALRRRLGMRKFSCRFLSSDFFSFLDLPILFTAFTVEPHDPVRSRRGEELPSRKRQILRLDASHAAVVNLMPPILPEHDDVSTTPRPFGEMPYLRCDAVCCALLCMTTDFHMQAGGGSTTSVLIVPFFCSNSS